jgi:hypothetical protein
MTAEAAARARAALGCEEIDLAPLREAFLRSGKTPADVARALGWRKPNGVADGPRVRRALGMRPAWSNGRKRLRQRCSYETAVKLADAIGVDPYEVGL